MQGLIKWRKWKDEIQPQCPLASTDKKVCDYKLCPCKRKEMDDWFDRRMAVWVKAELPGRFGAFMKLSRWFGERDAS